MPGQIYIAADGGNYGHVVIDSQTYADVDDIVVRGFSKTNGLDKETRRIDSFKLAMVRYTLIHEIPDWIQKIL